MLGDSPFASSEDMRAAGVHPWSITPSGLVVVVRLTPKGGRDAVDGIETLSDGRVVLKMRVRAAPTDGEANAALMALLAKTLDVARRTMTLAAGETARIKRIEIEGDGAALAARLEQILTDGHDRKDH